jgi:uroporphyrinogen III methyltransferase / synthase
VSAETVYLVGAGPGDPGLMTRRCLELIQTADAIVYDRLIPTTALEGARADAQLVYVGKQPGKPSLSQADINAKLITLAKQGLRVVRLKGGDPFVFGRGGEEAQALTESGVNYEVVPAVTAGVAAPAYAGIPITHRDAASAVCFVTGHFAEDDPAGIDWAALASFPGTIVCYMGIGHLGEIAQALIANGRPSTEPAAVIEAGTLARQRTVCGSLQDIAARVGDAGLRPPAVAVLGRVASMRPQLRWLEMRPLFGNRIVVTRARAQSSELAGRLQALGAEVIEAPAIKIVARPVEGHLRQCLSHIGDYDLLCLTSPNGVSHLFAGLEICGLDSRALAGVTVAAIGPGTANRLAQHGINADVLPKRSIAEGLIEALQSFQLAGKRVLIPRAAQARDVLVDALQQAGADVDCVALYDTQIGDIDPSVAEQVSKAHYITFTASSTVRYFLQALDDTDSCTDPKIVSIGPVTSDTARTHGLTVDVEATSHDIDGLVEALLDDARSGG